MTKIVEIEVNRQYLIALPDYENIRLGASVRAILEDGEDFTTVYNQLADQLDSHIQDDIDEFMDAGN